MELQTVPSTSNVQLVQPSLDLVTYNFAQPQATPGLTKQQYGDIISLLRNNLRIHDLKTLRLVCKGFNGGVIHLEKFRTNVLGVLSEKFYRDVGTWDRDNCVQWNDLEFNKFAFHRRSLHFPEYWTHAAQLLTIFVMKNSSFECEGFAKILNGAPSLQSITIDGVRGRDLTHAHLDSYETPNACIGPFQNQIREISFKNIQIMDDCFIDYLIARTGNIQKIEIENCYSHRETEAPVVAVPPFGIRAANFRKKIAELIMRNSGSIAKMSLKNNGNQSELLNSFMGNPNHNVNLVELELSFPKKEFNSETLALKAPDAQFPSTLNFIRSNAELQKLAIAFQGSVNQELLESFIVPHRQQHLTALMIDLPSQQAGGPTLNFAFLGRIPLLKSLNLNYKMELSKEEQKAVCKKPLQGNAEATRLQAPLDTTFLHSLSGSLNEISLTGFLRTENPFIPPDNAVREFSTNSHNLTKFEFIGPWLHDQGYLLKMISRNFGQLKVLTLKNCGIRDEHLMNVSPHNALRVVKFLRRGTPRDQLDAEIRSFPARTTIRSLTRLEYLDLSKNTKLTDASVYDVIRFNRLKILKLNWCDRIADLGFNCIADNNPNLEIIELKSVRNNVTSAGVNDLVVKCPKLKKVRITKRIGYVPKNPPSDDPGVVRYSFHPDYDAIVDISAPRTTKPKDLNAGVDDERRGVVGMVRGFFGI